MSMQLERTAWGVLQFFFILLVPWEDMTPTALPPGLKILEELVLPEEEKELLESIDWAEDEVTSAGK